MRVLHLLVRGLINMLQKTGLENKLQPAIAASEAKPVVELAEK